jgi:probable O-glycosylation ligase (exosortase A-associated)
MVVLTLGGVAGAFVFEPFVGVAIYYLFAVLRPQYLWQWALPEVGWSGYVAWATLGASAWFLLNGERSETPVSLGMPVAIPRGVPPARLARAVVAPRPVATREPPRSRLMFAHKAFYVFAAWICLTYLTAQSRDVAWPWFIEYVKLFVMFAVAALVLVRLDQVWWIYRLAAGALIYIAYELNYLYLVDGRLDIYHNGYGGLDNNGAGLMIAMGIPLALYAWEATTKIWRWAFLAGIPLMLHAVLMSYSRGAMLSLILVTPMLWVRSRRRKQFTAAMFLLALLVPYLAGYEIRQRFFSIEQYQTDDSANSRFNSWGAAFQIANEYPVFGVGIRNSSLLTYAHGADMEGRVIHSQYLQTLADAGYPGLFLYLLALASAWLAMARARRILKGSTGPEAALARSMLNGVEGSLMVFCVGASFLSLEVFELPYMMVLLGIQIALKVRVQPAAQPVIEHSVPLLAKRGAIPALRPRPS